MMEAMRREPEFFGDQELVLVYMARRLKEALRLEKVLAAGALDYSSCRRLHHRTHVSLSACGSVLLCRFTVRGPCRALILQGGFKPAKPK